MRAEDILNSTDPEEIRNILYRLRLQAESAQHPPLTEVISQLPSLFPPIIGNVVYVAGHDPNKILITDEGGNVTTDESLEFIRGTSYVLGSQLSTGTALGTNSAGVQITGLVIGQWYAIEGSGGPFHQHGSLPPFNGDYYSFELSTDGVTFSGEIGYSNTDTLLHLTLPSFAAYVEAVGIHYGRVYFLASTTSVWFRTIDGVWTDNSGSLDYKLYHVSALEKMITLDDVEYTKAKLAAAINTATEKTTLDDADEIAIWNSLTNQRGKISWENVGLLLPAILDALYAAIDHVHAADGSGEVVMEDGVTFPPVPVTTEDGTDWIYSD